jgi:hypothetical protein
LEVSTLSESDMASSDDFGAVLDWRWALRVRLRKAYQHGRSGWLANVDTCANGRINEIRYHITSHDRTQAGAILLKAILGWDDAKLGFASGIKHKALARSEAQRRSKGTTPPRLGAARAECIDEKGSGARPRPPGCTPITGRPSDKIV